LLIFSRSQWLLLCAVLLSMPAWSGGVMAQGYPPPGQPGAPQAANPLPPGQIHPATPAAKPGMTHRNERNVR